MEEILQTDKLQDVNLQEEIQTEIKEYPMVALRGLVVFPHMNLNFDVSREISVKAVEFAMKNGSPLFLTKQRLISTEEPEEADLERIGTLVRIRQITKLPNKNLRVLVEGTERARLCKATEGKGFLSAQIEICPEEVESFPEQGRKEAMFRQLEITLAEYLRFHPKNGKGLAEYMEKADKIGAALDFITVTLPIPVDKRQRVLESIALEERFEETCSILTEETYIAKVRLEFNEKVQKRVDKQQKEYVLREQLKVIREELGEDFNNFTSYFCDWNMLLDQEGGPFHNRTRKPKPGQKVFEDKSKGCHAPVLYNTQTGELIYTPIYYYIGHFSKYIQKGAVRVATTKHDYSLHSVAFRNPDGTIVLVAMNPTDEEQPAIIRHNDTCTQANLKPHSIMTAIW